MVADPEVRFERLLPGPVENVWSYLGKLPTEADRDGNAAGRHCHLIVPVDKWRPDASGVFGIFFRMVSEKYADGIPR